VPSVSIKKNKAVLKGTGHRVEFDLTCGEVTLYGQGSPRPALHQAAFGLICGEGEHSSLQPLRRTASRCAAPAWLGRGVGLQMTCREDSGLEFSLQAFAYAERPQLFFRLVVHQGGVARLTLKEMELFKLVQPLGPNLNFGTDLADLSLFRQGWDSWDVSQSIRVGELSGLLVATIDSFLYSHMSSLRRGLSTLMGFVGAQAQAGHMKYVWSADGRRLKEFRAMAEAAPWVLGPGESAESELLLVEAGPEGTSAKEERYLSLLGKAMGARVADRAPAGWSSWYFYWGEISEGAVLKNLEDLKHRGLDLDVMQVDDGWQKEIGQWTETSARFPHGMAWLAARIREKGFRPGLWLAPFLLSERSALFSRHPDWCVRDLQNGGRPLAYGTNWGATQYCLDPTHPGVKQHLAECFQAFRSWGFDYFKLDFLHAGAMEGVYARSGATRVQAFREGMALIRQLAGDSFLVACGAPLGPCIGLVDALRVGRDTGPKWDNSYDGLFADLRGKHPRAEPYLRKLSEYVDWPLKGGMALLRELMVSDRTLARWNSLGSAGGSLQDALVRAPLNGRLWLNDPDCLLLREKDTALSATERRSALSIAAMTGGLAFLSDEAGLVGEAAAGDFRRLLPAETRPAQPVDLAEQRVPRFLERGYRQPWGDWVLCQGLNPADNSQHLSLPLARLNGGFQKPVHVFDVWEERYLGRHHGRLDFGLMDPHASRLLALREDDGKAQCLGTSLHFSQGAFEFKSLSLERSRIRFQFAALPGPERTARVYFYLPGRQRAVEARASAGPAKLSFPQASVVCLEALAREGNEVTIQLGKV
jgi:alpha-galactosidase